MRSLAVKLQESPMFYKDLTQWLRGRGFSSLFFTILLGSLTICLMTSQLARNETNAGVTAFGFLYGVLALYALISGFSGYGLTMKELNSGTFELYELSGMSLERMIGGKFISLLYQFLFGFFCIVPFMFFSYLLGGLDFFFLLAGLIFGIMAASLFFLVVLAMAVATRWKPMQGVNVLLFVIGFMQAPFLFYGAFLSSNGLLKQFAAALSALVQGNLMVLVVAAWVLVIYALTCLMVFYIGCHVLARENDSREPQIKGLALLLLATLTATIALLPASSTSQMFIPELYPMVAAVLIYGTAILFYYNRSVAPVVLRVQQARAGLVGKLFFFLFRPGSVATLILLIAMVGLATFGASCRGSNFNGLSTTTPVEVRFWVAAEYYLQVFYFLAIPYYFFRFFLKGDKHLQTLRVIVLWWWILAGILISILVESRMTLEEFSFLSTLLSPVSSFVHNIAENHSGNSGGPFLFVSAAMLVVMYADARRRDQQAVA